MCVLGNPPFFFNKTPTESKETQTGTIITVSNNVVSIFLFIFVDANIRVKLITSQVFNGIFSFFLLSLIDAGLLTYHSIFTNKEIIT
jgi:hypothetical protein